VTSSIDAFIIIFYSFIHPFFSNATTLSSMSDLTSTSNTSSDNNISNTSSIDVDVKPDPVKVIGDPILTADLKDVELSLKPTVPIRRLNKKVKDHSAECFSNLSAICGVPPRDINTKFLRRFCTRHRIYVGSSSGNKRDCVLAIVKAKTDPPSKKQPAKHNKMNRLRYCNVIFGDESRNDLATRGDKLSAADLTDGLKTDELLHRKICMEYNNTDKYNDNAWPQLQACKGDPYLFPGPIVWDQSLKTLKTLIREYEYCFNNWKLSGNHGAFGEVGNEDTSRKPFADFIQSNTSLLYLHEFVYQYPNIFSKVTGKLPDGAFSESISTVTVTGPVTGSARKKRKGASDNDNGNKCLNDFNIIARTSKAAIRMHLMTESISKATHDIRGFTEKKSYLLRKAREEKSLSRTDLKEKFAQYEKSEEDGDFIDDDDSIASLYRNCKDLQRDIKKQTTTINHLEEELEIQQRNETKKRTEGMEQNGTEGTK